MEEPKKSKRINKGAWKHEAMAIRRKAAEERQDKYNKLTVTQRIQHLDDLKLTATKERAKLAKKMETKK